jgi:hypothetical protein
VGGARCPNCGGAAVRVPEPILSGEALMMAVGATALVTAFASLFQLKNYFDFPLPVNVALIAVGLLMLRAGIRMGMSKKRRCFLCGHVW